jgi:hypothetical protein
MYHEDVVIDKTVLGSDAHLCFGPSGFGLVETICQNAWHLSGEPKLYSRKCLDSLFRLNGIEFDQSPGKKWVSSVKCARGEKIPWSLILPRDEYRRFTERLVNKIKENIVEINSEYCDGTWNEAGGILRALSSARVKRDHVERIISENEMKSKTLQSLLPLDGDVLQVVRYNRFGTRTGRLIVESGPEILTLKKEFREVFVSKYSGGEILSLDFSSLEARVLLYTLGGDCDDPDLYGKIARDSFGDEAKRKIVKGAVLAELYGASRASLAATLGIDGGELEIFVRRIKKIFKTADLLLALKKEYADKGFISNAYGRRVPVDNPADHILVNSYAQSTGVDVSLLGFSSLVKRLKNISVDPLFVLHDALIVDCPKESLADIRMITSIRVPKFSQIFPVKIDKF